MLQIKNNSPKKNCFVIIEKEAQRTQIKHSVGAAKQHDEQTPLIPRANCLTPPKFKNENGPTLSSSLRRYDKVFN